jgi:hypothetical protein
MATIDWLLDSDPAIRWQVMRDILGAPADSVAAERARVATEGWGARLLALQAPDGQWGGATFSRGWTCTSHTLTLLRELGLDPASPEARTAIGRVRDHVTWGAEFDDHRFFEGEVEPCINGRTLAAGAYFGEPSAALVDRLLGEQLDDGGWNCEAPRSRRSSFHTTICVLEGLLAYEQARGPSSAVTAARLRGQDYLLERRLFRARSTGKIIRPDWTLFSFPTRWHYDVLRGLDYLRTAGLGADDRVAEAVRLVETRRRSDGRWPLENPHAGSDHFDLEDGAGAPSRWNTLRAIRVIDWYRTAPTRG